MTQDEFCTAIKGAKVGDRVITTSGHMDTGQVFINYYNLPADVVALRAGGGAELQNNRIMLTVETATNGKVKVENTVNALDIKRLRGKTAAPEKVIDYIVKYLEKVAAEVEPKFTHTKV